MKEAEYNFIGKNSEKLEVKKTATEILDQKLNTASEREIPNEVEKTEEEIKEIKEVENSINQELLDLGLKPDYRINPEDVHVLLAKRTDPLRFRAGSHSPLEPGVVLNRVNGSTLYVQLVHKILSKFRPIITDEKIRDLEDSTLTHEFIHDKSIHKYRISNEKDGSPKVSNYRLGYNILSDKPEDEWFAGFNEAVTEKTAMDIINKNRKQEERELKSKSLYNFNVDLVDKIAEKVAKDKGETKEDVWKRFKAGQFTGNMMHLRDIENTFGKDSLRVLASMIAVVRKEWKGSYYTYFTTDNKSKREKLAKRILG